MRRCLQLAELAAGNVAPNPMVGALLVHEDHIIGEGFHMIYGRAHAEVNCINNVPAHLQHLIPLSTMYVSLEPCTHFGKTPPCCDLIIRSGIRNVVIACKDSFQKVNGTGIQKLKDAGVTVTTGVLEDEAIALNRRFFTFQQQQRPYIILKWAQSSNLKIANADHSRVQISNVLSNKLVHKWRSEESAIMVGTRTAAIDNPALTTRLWPGTNPVRVVIDKYLKLPGHLQLFDNKAPTIILNTIRQEETGNTHYYSVGEAEDMVAVTLSLLRQRNLTSLIVEGGTVLLQSFIDAGCWDEARVITGMSILITNGIHAPRLEAIPYRREHLRDDEILYYRNTT